MTTLMLKFYSSAKNRYELVRSLESNCEVGTKIAIVMPDTFVMGVGDGHAVDKNCEKKVSVEFKKVIQIVSSHVEKLLIQKK